MSDVWSISDSSVPSEIASSGSSVADGSDGASVSFQPPVSCGKVSPRPPRLRSEPLLGPCVGAAQLRVEPRRPAPPYPTQ